MCEIWFRQNVYSHRSKALHIFAHSLEKGVNIFNLVR